MLALARFGANPLTYLDGLREDERDVVPFSLGKVHCHLIKNPEHLKLVLESEDWPPLSRGRLMALDKWYGGGLILTEGAEHHRQRDELWKPVLDDPASPAIGVARAARRARSWQEGEPVELFSELRSLCWSIDWEALTGEDLEEAPELLKAQETGTAAMQWLLGPFGTARWGSPAPTSVRTRAARSRLDGAIDAMIAERRARPRDDVLSRWVEREDDDQVIQATFKQWLGADQLHALFTWTLHLLAHDADVEARWHAELDEVLGDRPATADDVSALTFTRRVVKESLRLYPPIWGFFRQVTGDYRLDGASIPEGHVIAMSQWVTHRDPDLWAQAERFDPERWADGVPRPPAVSYFPFSAGPYECHAGRLAMTEAVLVLATLGQHWAFRPADPREPRPTATGTIVPKGGMRMTPTARERA
ncbi:MAG: cytochrome P450 [Solirubrobacteraceae bacterium]